MSKLSKVVAQNEKVVNAADGPPQKRVRAALEAQKANEKVTVPAPISPKQHTRKSAAEQAKRINSSIDPTPPNVAGILPPLTSTSSSQDPLTLVGFTRGSAHRNPHVISQPIQPGTGETFDTSEEDSDCDLSDEECDDIKTDQLLKLVMKEQHQIRRERLERQQETNPPGPALEANAKQVGTRRRTRATAAPEIIPPADTGYFPHVHPMDPVAALKREVIDREFVRVHHTAFASDITMSISDTMLKPDFSAHFGPSGEEMRNIGMATTLQATRPVVSNTKFFRLIREDRKRKAKAEKAERSASGEVDVVPDTTVPTPKLKTKRRVLDVLCNSDSEQEKEDSAMLMLLGE